MARRLRQYTAHARPYAQAVFALATQHKQQDIWQEALNIAAQGVILGNKRKLFVNPQITHAEKMSFFSALVAHFPDIMGLLHLLIDRKKITLLPVIAAIYEQLILTKKQILKVRVIAAFALTASAKEHLIAALAKRYQQEIMLDCSVNPALLGGAILYIRDQKFDGSWQGILQRLHKVCGVKN